MSFITLLLFLIIIAAITLVIRSIIRIYKRTSQSPLPVAKFPVFSICMLSISLLLLIVGTIISLQVSDALGGAIASIGGFFGMFESHVRHKREALLNKVTEKEPVSENVK